MKFNDYEVNITPGDELDNGYVCLEHNTKYSITLTNRNYNDCDAQVHIDGVSVGTFRIKSNSSSTIDRPISEDGCFTFLKFESNEANKAKLIKTIDLGLVSVLFMPGKAISIPFSKQQGGMNQGYSPQQSAPQRVSAGGTGLSGKSSQQFRNVKKLEYDEEKNIKIILRLVCKEKDEVRPLAVKETETPPSLFESFEDASCYAKSKKSGSVVRSRDGEGFIWRHSNHK
ncbi:hypothetical protein AB4140_08910 [Shewanella sp. 10N.286.51.B2]|uniref:hypothetical protein n=1 Tax=Shewanella sp. 10N.286.51.B2 TaxID=3229707 RepID=UPI00354D96F0